MTRTLPTGFKVQILLSEKDLFITNGEIRYQAYKMNVPVALNYGYFAHILDNYHADSLVRAKEVWMLIERYKCSDGYEVRVILKDSSEIFALFTMFKLKCT